VLLFKLRWPISFFHYRFFNVRLEFLHLFLRPVLGLFPGRFLFWPLPLLPEARDHDSEHDRQDDDEDQHQQHQVVPQYNGRPLRNGDRDRLLVALAVPVRHPGLEGVRPHILVRGLPLDVPRGRVDGHARRRPPVKGIGQHIACVRVRGCKGIVEGLADADLRPGGLARDRGAHIYF